MQLLSVDTATYRKYIFYLFCPLKHKNLPSKVAYFSCKNFQYCQVAPNQPKSQIMLYKTIYNDFGQGAKKVKENNSPHCNWLSII